MMLNHKILDVLRRHSLKYFNQILYIFLVFLIWFVSPSIVSAKLASTPIEGGLNVTRSSESLRDLDFQTWQVVVYRNNDSDHQIILRIVGFPGRLRLDHPSNLLVHSGLREWSLSDVTLLNSVLESDNRQAAAEFDLSPLLTDLTNNRPLRLELPDVFEELPVPPYLVKEWRSLLELPGN